jgi:predicted NBD/HSP70 family sugar kinase
MTRAAIPPLLKDLNERTVLETIRTEAPISRAEISRRVGISKPTVSLALRSLVDAGLVREAAHDPAGPSYGAVFFEPVPDAALVLGFDLGARFVRGAICDLAGNVRARQDVESSDVDADKAIDAIVSLRDSLVAASGFANGRFDGAVVGVPGVVETTKGRINLATNIPGLEDRDFGSELGERLGVPVALDNDINLAALGEQWRGVAHGVDDFVFLSIGTGFGAGLVLRGELHRGHHGAAGEVDYTLPGLDGAADPSAAAVSAFAAALAADGRVTTVARPYDVRAIFAAARAGDTLARDVVAETGRRIALHIAPIAALTDVGLVVLGGGIGANRELVDEIRPLLERWLPYPPRLEISSLGEAAVLIGALSAGLNAALDNVFVNRERAVRA